MDGVSPDWAINALAGQPKVVNTIHQLAPEGIAISLITVGELYEGAFGFPEPPAHLEYMRAFLQPFKSLNLSESIVEIFAETRSLLRRQGNLIPDFDILLGATAVYHDLTLLTNNLRHFNRIPDLKLYRGE